MAVGDVFIDQFGNQLVPYMSSGLAHDTSREPTQTNGWRERKDGTRERVLFRDDEWTAASESRSARHSSSSTTLPVKPFPGHLQIWYEEEERRNPGWQDLVPKGDD